MGGGRKREGEEREVWRWTGKGDQPALACAPPLVGTLAEREDEREREKEGEKGEREEKGEGGATADEREDHRPASACAGQDGRALEVGGGSIRSWIGNCDGAGSRARFTGGCTPPLPRGAADGGSCGRAADGGLSGWAMTPTAGVLPMDSRTARGALDKLGLSQWGRRWSIWMSSWSTHSFDVCAQDGEVR